MNLENVSSTTLVECLEEAIIDGRDEIADDIREELGSRCTPPDENDPDYDEARGRHSGVCRGCNTMQPDCSNDDGYCGDCN